jgi:hypothetical protein
MSEKEMILVRIGIRFLPWVVMAIVIWIWGREVSDE